MRGYDFIESYTPITNTQRKHSIDYSCCILQFLILPEVTGDVVLYTSHVNSILTCTLFALVGFDSKVAEMLACHV